MSRNLPGEEGRTAGPDTQTQEDTHLRAYNNNDARPQPRMGQVHLVEVVDSQPQIGRPLMRNRGRTTGMGIRKGMDHVRSPWGISRGKFYAGEVSKYPRYS